MTDRALGHQCNQPFPLSTLQRCRTQPVGFHYRGTMQWQWQCGGWAAAAAGGPWICFSVCRGAPANSASRVQGCIAIHCPTPHQGCRGARLDTVGVFLPRVHFCRRGSRGAGVQGCRGAVQKIPLRGSRSAGVQTPTTLCRGVCGVHAPLAPPGNFKIPIASSLPMTHC
jgi:hypothetical protein